MDLSQVYFEVVFNWNVFSPENSEHSQQLMSVYF